MNRYTVIAKIEAEKFVKYRVNNLLKFTRFLDDSFPNWRWFNVYKNEKQVGNFTNKNRPTSSRL